MADTAALGSILIPAMSQAGYSTAFSAAVTAASSVIGPIIPQHHHGPLRVDHGRFHCRALRGGRGAGAAVRRGIDDPGRDHLKKRDYPIGDKRATIGEIWASFKESFLALIMPVLILGGILGGVFTPTEAAAVAVLYACLVGFSSSRR